MLFFLDSAELAEIQSANTLGILDGVTTNPSLLAKANIAKEAIFEHYKAICNTVEDNVSVEVIATDFDAMLKEAYELAALDKKIVVKIPITKNGLQVIKKLSEEGIRTNCTLIFSAGQAILAAKAGATYISPFIGRLDDIAADGLALIKQITTVYQKNYFNTQVLAASIRHPMHIIQCAQQGVDVVTCPLPVIEKLLHHPLTDDGLKNFLADYHATFK